MVEIKKLDKYTPEIGERVRELLIQLSRSGKDKGEIPEEWFLDVIESPYHDLLVAWDEGRIVGIGTLSITNGPGARKSAYLEDFVVDGSTRGKGVGNLLWEAMVEWTREKGAKKLIFTCGAGREASQEFYKKRGAEIYETNFFRSEV